MKSVLYILLVLLLCSASLHGQTVDIRGTVSDSVSGERVPYASIVVKGTRTGASTNVSGFYVLTNLSPGSYDVTASSIGYDRKTLRIDVIAGRPATLNFELHPQAVEFSEVIVTDRASRELTEINTSIHVMDAKEMQAIPAALLPDVFRSIAILPGVVSASDVNTHFYVRGGGGDQNMILLDGMKVYNPFHAFGLLSIFDPDIIKSTEVFTGAFPPGYGGRLSSVVNMVTRDGNRKDYTARADVNLTSSKVRVEGPFLDRSRFLLNGRVSTLQNSLHRVLHKDLPLSFYDAFVKLTSDSYDGQARYGVTGFFSGDRLTSPLASEPDYDWRNQAIGITGGGLIDERLFVEVVAYENTFEARREPKASKVTGARTSVRETGIRTNATKYTDSRDLYFFGFEFSFPRMHYSLVNNLGAPKELSTSFVDFWTWLRYQTTIGHLQLDGGFHVDVGSLFQRSAGLEVIEPRLNASYGFLDRWHAKFSYGRFSQHVITVNNEDDVIAIFDAWIAVPDNVSSEYADHVVVGMEGTPFPEVSVALQAYDKRYASLVAYNRDKIDATDPDYVRGTGRAYGLETLFRYGITDVDVYATYTLGWTTVTSGGLTYHPRYDRRHSANILTVYRFTERAEASVRWELGSGMPYTSSIGYYDRLGFETLFNQGYVREAGTPYLRLGAKNDMRLPVYHRMDVALKYRFEIGPLRGSAGVQIANIYGRKNVFYVDRTTGQVITQMPFFPSITVSAEI